MQLQSCLLRGATAIIDSVLQLRPLTPELTDALIAFFDEISSDQYFHPHPFTAYQARMICQHRGKDLYLAAIENNLVVGYGMLRGWDEGYATPSLGIALSRTVRGRGLGKLFMSYLHYVAKQHGASSIRLKVYPHNLVAISLYRALGYTIVEEIERDQYVGTISL